jgi:preprotein translocase subunit SecE
MATTEVARPRPAGRMSAFIAGMPSGYRNIVAEMKKVTWPDRPQVRQATIAIIAFVLLIGAVISLLDVTLQGLLVRLIPSLFAGR